MALIDVSPELEQWRFGSMDRDEAPKPYENKCSLAVISRFPESLEKRLECTGIPQLGERERCFPPKATSQQTYKRLDSAGIPQLP
jgi:hypothetical protein